MDKFISFQSQSCTVATPSRQTCQSSTLSTPSPQTCPSSTLSTPSPQTSSGSTAAHTSRESQNSQVEDDEVIPGTEDESSLNLTLEPTQEATQVSFCPISFCPIKMYNVTIF